MDKLIALILGLLLSQYVSADEWLCTTESGQRQGRSILACGIGDALNDEATARRRALQNAVDEFNTICKMSADCKDKKTIVIPKRTQCVVDKIGLTKCYRLIEVEILE